jgi:glycerol-3-phosphate acyltransferase PlsX
MSTLTIALDAMGGDHGPPIIISGAIKALHQHPHLHLIICGDEPQISPHLQEIQTQFSQRIRILHCQDTILMTDKPAEALRYKKDASMRRAIELVQQNKADACVSAGNTGALFAIAAVLLKTLPGIDRPALVTHLPSQTGVPVWLLDLGANVNNSADTLVQNAVMGSVLAAQQAELPPQHVPREAPRVALLNVGEEHNKGHDVVKQAHLALSKLNKIHYIGFIEANDILTGKADVVVTDGFTGNVALKASEGIYQYLRHAVKQLSQQSLWMKILATMTLPLLQRLYQKMKPDQYNGASLIGLRGIVVKSHGNANANAVCYAISQAVAEVEQQIPQRIKTTISNILLE